MVCGRCAECSNGVRVVILVRRAFVFACLPVRRVLAAISIFLIFATLSACTSSRDNTITGSTGGDPSFVSSYAGDLRVVSYLPPPEKSGSSAGQRIFPNDILEIDVFKVDELDRTIRVEPSGNVSMPLIGTVRAAGLTVIEFERSLERKYSAKYLQGAEITVFMKESFGLRLTMDGEFKRPGIYPGTSQTTLMQAVAQAGGLTALADEQKLYVFRQYPGGKRVANYSISAIRNGKKVDPKLYGGDIIVAFASKSKIATQNLRQALGIASSAVRVAAPL